MREQCPQCGHKFGWRGPRRVVQTMGRWKTKASVRYFCSSCHAELEHRQSRAEQLAWLVNVASLSVLLGGLMLRDSYIARVSHEILVVAAALAVISFVIGTLAWARSQHFVTATMQD